MHSWTDNMQCNLDHMEDASWSTEPEKAYCVECDCLLHEHTNHDEELCFCSVDCAGIWLGSRNLKEEEAVK